MRETHIHGQLFFLLLMLLLSISLCAWDCVRDVSYQTAGGRLVSALASNLEGDIVWGVALDLESSLGKVVEVLVDKLFSQSVNVQKPHISASITYVVGRL